jgi:hypothetical protein
VGGNQRKADVKTSFNEISLARTTLG